MKKRMFDNENINKLDGLLRYLFERGIKYCVLCQGNRDKANIIVSWYEVA